LLYYLGGFLAIGAMTRFMTLGWEAFGGWGILFISLLYMAAGLLLVQQFANKGLVIPAGICGTFVVVVTPLAVYGLQVSLGIWPDESVYRDYHTLIRWHWIYMELATLAVGSILLWRYRYPFMVMPVAVTLWYLSLDVADMWFGAWAEWPLRGLISLWFGLLMVLLGIWIDLKKQSSADFAFWLYLFGVFAFWGGLTSQHSDAQFDKFIYCLINLFMMVFGVLLARRVFVVFGALGVTIYLGNLAYGVFRESWLFPVMLTLIGLAVIYCGVIWQKHEARFTAILQSRLPLAWQKRLQR
jgi:hypothetical protein